LAKSIINSKDIKPLEIDGLFGGQGKFLRFPMYNDADAPPFTVIAETEMEPGSSIGMHTQTDQQELLYLLAGNGQITIDGETTQVGKGDAILARAGCSFSLQNTGHDPIRYLVVKCRLC
jgi:quercetin dioxygenase-like cupin family protein